MTFWPSSKWVWAFTLISLTQAAAVLALEVYVFIRFQQDVIDKNGNSQDPTTTIPTFLALYIFAFVYQLVLVWDALRMKNTIQIIGLVGLNLGLLIYGAVQVEQLREADLQLRIEQEVKPNAFPFETTKPLLIAIPVILAFFTILMALAAYKLYNEFAWTIYKHISADLRMKKRYLTYQIYIALLKFDFFFTLGFTIQFVVIVRGRNDIERWITAAAIPVTILIMLAAFWFTRRESKIGSIIVIILYFGGLGYFCFKLVRMYQTGKKNAYMAARKELTTFAVLTIGLLISTIIVAIMCFMNYGKGLKPYVMHGNTKAVVSPNSRPEFDTEMHGQANPWNQPSYSMQPESYSQKSSNNRPLAATRMEID